MSTNVLLVGYGAVGFVYAYALEKSGVKVTVVARSNYQAASTGAIKLKSDYYGDAEGFKPTRVVSRVAEAADQAYDYVLLSTKSLPEITPTSAILAPILASSYPHPQPTYVLLQNGLGVEKDLYAAVQKRGDTKPARIISCAIYIMTNMTNNVVVHGTYQRLEAGVYLEDRSPDAEDHADANRLVGIFKNANITASASDNIEAAKFRKNMWNSCFATVSCLTRTNAYCFFENEALTQKIEPTLLAICEEASSIGRALGYPPEYIKDSRVAVDDLKALFNEGAKHHKPSTLIDVENGKPFELEVILGELVRRGQKAGVPIPRLESIYAMLSVIQNQFIKSAKERKPSP